MRKLLAVLLVASLAAFAAFAQAQFPPGPPPGGPGGPGFPPGGPGMRGLGFGPPDGGLGLLAVPEVQKELALTDDQKKVADDALADLQDQLRASFESLNPQELQSLDDTAREKRFAEMRTKSERVAAMAREKIETSLKPSQQERFKQLQLQRDGGNGLLRKELIEKLALSDSQQKKLQSLQEDRPPFFVSDEERKKLQSDALAVLNDDQRAQWKSLQGSDFAFPEEALGPPPGPFGRGPGGRGGPGGGPGGQERKLLAEFDKDNDGRLNTAERKAARAASKRQGAGSRQGPGGRPDRGPNAGPRGGAGFGPPDGARGDRRPDGPPPGDRPERGGPERDGAGRDEQARGGPPYTANGRPPRGPGGPGAFGGPGGFGGRSREPGKAGPRVSPDEVKSLTTPFYSPENGIRTIFLDFEDADWEAELADFYKTDVDVPATLICDGQSYPEVGVHFRGMSSFFAVPAGSKRSLNITLDHADPKQRLHGYKTLNLLNAHEDPSFLHTVLYFYIARQFIPAPKANFVRLVINGESWGLYTNVQQFNKEFIDENFPGQKGTRWKVPGSPGGRGGLEYFGEDAAAYKRVYQIKSKDDDKAWTALIKLCKTLNETSPDQLEKALEPMLDIDGALWFLALENVLINSDGYWIRASDYSIFLDDKGKFHILPHDANETFQPAMGPGVGRGTSGVELDPLVGLNDKSKPLRSRLLAVPALRARYLSHVRTLADDWLDWNELKTDVEALVASIDPIVEADTRKLSSYAEFQSITSEKHHAAEQPGGRRGHVSLRDFMDSRRAYLLNYPEIKALPADQSR